MDEKPFGLTESLFYYKHIELMAEYAELMQQDDDMVYYQNITKLIKSHILDTYYNPDTGVFANGTQTAQVFGLGGDLLHDSAKVKALIALEKSVNNRDYHISTGIFGTKMMFDVLRKYNMNEQMYRIANQRDFPGWGYMIEKGATSLWETWAYSDNVYSQNHPMFGSISEWFYRSLLGINPDAPGFKKITIKPQPAGDLTFAQGSYHSTQGLISVDWKISEEKFILQVEIPVNTTAEIYIPSSSGKVTESGVEIKNNKTANKKGEKSYISLSVGSGKYQFETDYK